MFRRAITVVVLVMGAVLAPCQTQQPTKVPRVGFLAPQGRSLPLLDAFRQGLADLGYVEGRNVVIEPRFAEGQYERFPELIGELVGLKVDVLAVTGAVTARAAKKAAPDILSRLSWKWRKRSSVKIAERTYEKRAQALHC